jgi:AraC family transcriptional regulator
MTADAAGLVYKMPDSCRVPSRAPKTVTFTAADTMIELLLTADRALGSDQECAKELIDRVVEILRTTTESSEADIPTRPTPGSLAPWQIRRLTAYIERHIDIPLGNAELAQLVNLSRSYFSRAFKKSFGTAPHAYVTMRRTMRAQAMMLTTNEPLSQIAVACGMVDQSRLCKLFRRHVGSNPHAWRRTFKADRHTRHPD